MRILGLCGSLRRGSYNLQLLDAAARLLPEGATWRVFDELGAIPPYSEDAEKETPSSVRALRAAIADADGILIATPEYNVSIPGQLKNALDWVSRPHRTCPIRGKPVAVIGASVSMYGAIWAQAELRKVLRTMGSAVIDHGVPVGQADDAFSHDGSLEDPQLHGALQGVVHELLGVASRELIQQSA